ncbi:fimbrial protein [Pasteurella sp. PK-2025]|uniref:fimbrial protein n=1 Tax=unclassified Pasteurella TaxID=2621516 RepID=UPI003C78F60B
MKKLLIALSMAALFSGSALADSDVSLEVSDVSDLERTAITTSEINFLGEVAQHTCSIVKKGAKNQLVTLPKVLVDKLNENKSGTGNTSFDIDLENCTYFNGQNVTILFEPKSGSVENNLLKNTASEEYKANNVFIKLTQDSRDILLSGSDADSQNVQSIPLKSSEEVSSNPYKFSFTAQYVVQGGEATPGLVQAVLPFKITYK